MLLKIALKNVKKVYDNEEIISDITDVDEFLNENIKGIYLTIPNLESIKEIV